MKKRFDGRLGLSVGFLDKSDPLLEAALASAVYEEMDYLPPNFEILSKDYLFGMKNEEKCYFLHFHAKEVAWKDYLAIKTIGKNHLFKLVKNSKRFYYFHNLFSMEKLI